MAHDLLRPSTLILLAAFLFLSELFSGDWPRKIHALRDFVAEIAIATGLWLPLIAALHRTRRADDARDR